MAPIRCPTPSHNVTSMTATPSTSFATLVLNVAQASDANNVNPNDYSNHIAVIFGVAATLLAAASIVIGVLQWRACKRRLCDGRASDDIEMGVPGVATDDEIDAVNTCAPGKRSTNLSSCSTQHGEDGPDSDAKSTTSGDTACASTSNGQFDVAKGDG